MTSMPAPAMLATNKQDVFTRLAMQAAMMAMPAPLIIAIRRPDAPTSQWFAMTSFHAPMMSAVRKQEDVFIRLTMQAATMRIAAPVTSVIRKAGVSLFLLI